MKERGEGFSLSHTELDELFRQAPAFLAVLEGPDHVFVRVNDSYRQLIGQRDVVGKPLMEALPELSGQGFDKLLDGVLQTGQPFIASAIRARIVRTPGAPPEDVFVDLTYHPLRGPDGVPIGVIALGIDVTQQEIARKAAEEASVELSAQVENTQELAAELEQSNEQLQEMNLELEEARDRAERASARVTEVLDCLTDSVSVFDREWRWRYLNPAAATMLRAMGKDPDTVIGKVIWEELPNLRGTRFETETLRAATEGRVVAYEEFFPALGSWLEVGVVPSRSGLTSFARDVTARHRADDDLRDSEEQFRTALNSIPTLSWIANADGWIFWYNNQWYEYTGTTPAEMEGWGWQSVHDPEVLPAVLERWTGSIATGAAFEMEFPLRSRSGDFRWFLTRVSPLRDAQGEIRRWFGTNTDVHVQREAVEAARSANQAKSDFLAAMSHETRQPINATLGFIDILEMGMYGEVAAQQRQALARIRTNQEQLLSIITDIMSFARLEAGRVEFENEPVQCLELLRALPALVEPQAMARELRMDILECPAELVVAGDRNRIVQICTNLLTNAIRATDRGGRISVRCLPNGPMVDIVVTDTGSGIAGEKLEAIFSPFIQLERKLNSPREGVGLGLPISRDLARGMNGDIRVKSTVGVGSTFTLALPRWGDQPALRAS